MPLPEEVAAVRQFLARGAGHAHLMGIGGVGMAGLAVHLADRGLRVSGCDASASSVTRWLEAKGIQVLSGHDARHVQNDVDVLIHTSAVRDHQAEVREALVRGLPIFRRGAVLPALLDGRTSVAVTGTHGKTTTTAMVTQVLRGCGVDAGFAIGGEVDALGGVAGTGRDPYLVVEADESDGTVAGYAPSVAVVTNAELDHVDYFKSALELHHCLAAFCRQASSSAIVFGDDPGASAAGAEARRGVRYGFGPGNDWRAMKLADEPVGVSFVAQGPSGASTRVRLPVAGRHNVLNALAAVAVAAELELPLDRAAEALGRFGPARRRFETIAQAQGITVVSDYAHHPTEIRALLSQARRVKARRRIAVFQPHRYSRTRAFAAEFADAFSGVDALVLAPVYAASEPVVNGGRSEDVFPLFALRHPGRARLAGSLEEAWSFLRADLQPDDLLLVIGAGDVEKIAFWAREFLQAGGISNK